MKKINNRGVRIYLPFVMLFVGFGIIQFRLYQLQIVEHEKYSSLAREKQIRIVNVLPQRGIIYDRNLKPLAVNVVSYSLYASPRMISHPEKVAEKLAPLLGLEKEVILTALKKDRVFVWLKRKLSLKIREKIIKLGFKGLGFIEEKKRFYPERELASHLLGWVGIDNQGLAGVEYYYEEKLQGKKGKILLRRDALGYPIPFTQTVLKKVIPGKSIVLTIDTKIQSIVEQELSRALGETGATSAEAIFMDPWSGEILALVNKPDYDPNSFRDYSSFERKNRIVQSLYEPGSTFKVVTSAALLEEGLVDPEERIYCSASIQFGNHTIYDWKEFNRKMDFTEIVYNSSDVGIIKLAQRMDKSTFYRYIINFGFGRKTGIDLPGETRGIVKPTREWYLTDFPCISMGQGIAVTPLQMVVALSAAINDGNLLQPYVVKKVLNLKGEVIRENKPRIIKRVISPQTSEKLREILGKVVEKGTGKKSKVRGYSIGGKTGTAQIPSSEIRGYLEDRYIASFMGFAPVGNPEIAGIVVIKEPAGAYWGGEVAAPVFGNILSRILPLLGVLPEKELWVRSERNESEK
jgi:cell division protein FtsI/penicillin-binding protein 2